MNSLLEKFKEVLKKNIGQLMFGDTFKISYSSFSSSSPPDQSSKVSVGHQLSNYRALNS